MSLFFPTWFDPGTTLTPTDVQWHTKRRVADAREVACPICTESERFPVPFSVMPLMPRPQGTAQAAETLRKLYERSERIE